MRLRIFIETKRSEDKFISSIGKKFGKNCMLAYGNYSRRTQMKHFMPTIGVGLRRLINRKYFTFTVDEFLTTKKCSECFNRTRLYKDDDTKKKTRGLVVCENCVKPKTENSNREDTIVVFRNRDKNAALNIMNIAKYFLLNRGLRHPHFSRQQTCFSPVIGVS